MTPTATITPFGERGWLARLTGDDHIASGLVANAIADAIRRQAGIDDAVAGIDSVAVRFDPAQLNGEQARIVLERVVASMQADDASGKDIVTIPICYGGEMGPDLADLASHAGLSETQIIRLHSGTTYRVATLGFAPGFAYMGMLDDALHMPRHDTPRLNLAAGSVGIAGAFTGIYPLPSPGGWRIIGRTPRALYDRTADDPFLLGAGKTVKFEPISAEQFTEWGAP